MTQLDLVIRGGTVIDGNADSSGFVADVGIVDGAIAEVGDLTDRETKRVIDASGRIVAPGFIDSHTHIEMAALHHTPDANAAVRQGITTTMVGADGFGWVGIEAGLRRRWWEDSAAVYGMPPEDLPDWQHPADFLRDLREASSHSVVPLVPHGNVRAAVMGDRPGAADSDERRAMRAVVETWMEAGAVGMATGLDYLPARYATTDELVELTGVVASGGGVYASHVRLIDGGREAAWREAAEIGRRAGVGVRIAHERLDVEAAALLDELSSDVDLTIDSYVYPAGCTSLTFHVPAADQAQGVMALSRRLATDSDLADRLAVHLEEKMTGNPGQEAILAATTSGGLEGRMLSELAAERNCTVGEVAVDLLRDEMPVALLIYVWQNADHIWDETVARTLADPRAFIASDGVYLGSSAHPRGFGTFPRVIGELARDQGLLSVANAVHKMTGRPADAYGLTDRGRVVVGQRADLVVFDLDTIGCGANIENPRTLPTGIEAVLVGGAIQGEPSQ